MKTHMFLNLETSKAESLLLSVKGVGKYTARLALVLATRKYDLPPIDRWLSRIITTVYNVSEKEAENKWKSIWGEYSGLASVLVTITLDAEPLSKALDRIRQGKLLPKTDNKITPLTLWKHL